MIENHPLAIPKTKEELQAEITKLKRLADFWRNHWLSVYIIAGFSLYKMYSSWRTSRALGRLVNYVESKPEIMAAKNPRLKAKALRPFSHLSNAKLEKYIERTKRRIVAAEIAYKGKGKWPKKVSNLIDSYDAAVNEFHLRHRS